MKEFDKIIGYDEERHELERICDTLRNTKKYKALGVNTPRGCFIHGEPGLGKTLMANCIIKASGRRTFVCRKYKPNGDFVKYIKQTFDDAKDAAPSIVFLDDMDKFANGDRFHKNCEEFITVQSCIDDCRGTEVFVLATANDIECLPDSLLRVGRFDKVIDIQPPKYKDALKIIEYYISQKKYVKDVDIEEITRIMDGHSCADLETVINEAGIYAGYAGRNCIAMDDIIKACLRIIFDAPEAIQSNNDFIDEIAYHEAGHAVCSLALEPDSIDLISVASYNGKIGGVTSFFRNQNYYKSKELMENRVRTILGGRAAIEIVYGKTDVGANHDLHRAFDIVERFVDNYCSTGFGMFERRTNGDDLLNRKDMAITLEMERFYGEAKQILAQNRELLDKLATELIERRTLLRKDIARIQDDCMKNSA